MKQSILLLILATVFLCGCGKNNRTVVASGILNTDNGITVKYNGMIYRIIEIRPCKYPANNPVYEKKANKKLLLFRLQIAKQEKMSHASLPLGAIMVDSRGNDYETQPGVIAMAQASGCIKGDDIKAYNKIWNGELKTGQTETAFVLGFEIPDDALPMKLYWNKEWRMKNIFFFFIDTNYTINH